MFEFYKYHGAGNDFIVIDDREKKFNARYTEKIKLLCHRRFGIGADGLILIQEKKGYDFEMIYFNSDGSRGAMCGNGGRCAVHFAHHVLKIVKNPEKVKFLAADGEHEASILPNGEIKLKMQEVKSVGERNGLPFLYSGTTPHNVMFVKDLKKFPVFERGREIRYLDKKEGVNVNFVEIKNGILYARTYERGVENETMACGTGAVCIAVASHYLGKFKGNSCKIKMPGGELKVEFEIRSARQGLAEKTKGVSYKNIWLTGPAVSVFKGELE